VLCHAQGVWAYSTGIRNTSLPYDRHQYTVYDTVPCQMHNFTSQQDSWSLGSLTLTQISLNTKEQCHVAPRSVLTQKSSATWHTCHVWSVLFSDFTVLRFQVGTMP